MRALRRRLLRFAVRALLVVVVLIIGAYLLRDQVLSRPLAKIVSDALSEALGGEFKVQRIEGDLHTEITFVGLRTVREPTRGVLRRIAADRVTLRYSLSNLLGGDLWNAVRSIKLTGGDVEIDLTPDVDPSPRADSGPLSLPARFPKLAIETRLVVRHEGFAAERLRIDGDGTSYAVELNGLTLPVGTRQEQFRAVVSSYGERAV